MALNVELKPDVERQLQRKAELLGKSVSEYAASLLETQVQAAKLEARQRKIQGAEEARLSEAVRVMKENQIKNREFAVQVITQANNLWEELSKVERIVTEYERKEQDLRNKGNVEYAEMAQEKKERWASMLPDLRASHAAAAIAADEVKQAVRREEERILVKTHEAMALIGKIEQARALDIIRDSVDSLQLSSVSAPEGWDSEWRAAYSAWMENLDARTKEALQQPSRIPLKHRIRAVKRRIFKGYADE